MLFPRFAQRSGYKWRRQLLASLSLDQAFELTLHGSKRVVNDFAQRLVHLVLALPFIDDQLVTRRHGHVDPHPERTAGMLGVIRLLYHHVAAADVIAETVEPRCLIANEFFKLVRFLDTPIRNFDR